MAGMNQADVREPLSSRALAWTGIAGVGLLLLALLRGSIEHAWDLGCTLLLASGGTALLVWAIGHREALRRGATSRKARYGGHVAASSLLLLVGLGLLNFLATRHNRSFDLTESRLFTLSPQTEEVLRGLPRDVRLLAFFPRDRRGQAAELLSRYAERSPRLRYEFIDPDQEPERAQQYDVTAYGTVVVEVARRAGAPAPSGRPVRVEAHPAGGRGLVLSEEALTNALLKVTRGGTKTIYFLEGHGEAEINDPTRIGYARVRRALEGQAFVVRRLYLGRAVKVPAECDVLVIAGPSKELLPAEQAAIERYLEQGGKAFILVDPLPGVGLERLLNRWGVRVERDLVLDTTGAGRLFGAGPGTPLVNDYEAHHPITRNFRLTTFFPLARSLRPTEAPGDSAIWPLAQTGSEAFAQPYDGGARRARFDPTRDRKGPLLLAVAVTRQVGEGKQARLVVIGDSDFISNAFFDRAGNSDFFLACVNWLAEEESLIALRPRPRQDRRVQLTEQQMRGVFWLVVVGMPLSALALGVVVQWRRR